MKLDKVVDKAEIKKYITLLYSELFGASSIPTDEAFEQIFAQLDNPNNPHEAYTLVDGSTVIAFFTLVESFAIFAQGKYGIINELWVNQAYRSQGVGQKVINEICNIARQRHWQRVDVSAPADAKWDRTFSFYQKNGFTFTGRKLKISP